MKVNPDPRLRAIGLAMMLIGAMHICIGLWVLLVK